MKPPNEQLPRLRAALDKYDVAQNDVTAHSRLHDEASAAIADFTATGDLRNLEAIAAITPRQTQISLIERRMDELGKAAATAEQELGDALAVARGELRDAANKIRCAVVEKAARAMEEHFDSLQSARRQAFSSVAGKAKSDVILTIENLGAYNEELPEVAKTFLDMAPGLFGEVAKFEKELGGKIPGEGELRAI